VWPWKKKPQQTVEQSAAATVEGSPMADQQLKTTEERLDAVPVTISTALAAFRDEILTAVGKLVAEQMTVTEAAKAPVADAPAPAPAPALPFAVESALPPETKIVLCFGIGANGKPGHWFEYR